MEVSRISPFVHDNSPLRLSIPTASAALALAFAFCSPIRAAVPTDPARTTAYAGDRIILKFKSEAHDAAKSGLHTALGAQKIERLDCIDAEVIRLQPGMSVEAAIAAALQDPEVEYAEPDYELRIARLPNDPRLNELYAIQNHGQTGGFPGADIHMASAWDVFTGNSEIKVGIIDTGVDYTHPDLAANIWTNPGEVPGNSVDDDRNGYVDDVHGYDFVGQDGDPMDDHAHGTHCAGTIGAVGDNSEGIAGINWHCRIVAIKFMDDLGRGNLSNAIRGIEYAIRVGAAVTSNSYEGGGYSRAFQDAIAAAGRANQLFVAAAGNAGADNDIAPVYPAGYDLPNVIAVAATDHKDRLAGFSNYGARSVDLAAPGVAILSTKLGGGYLASSGTSMAAPHVAGAATLLCGLHPEMPAATIKALLLSGTDPIPALTGRCVSGGRLNVARALVGTDAVPPAGVADLLAVSTPSAVALLFTAPGDDGATGRATRYEVRYAPTPIDAARFAAATAVTAPAPQAAGTAERFEISGLAFGTTYYFALKTFDEYGNASPLSNVAVTRTGGAPEIAVSPASVSSRLASGATTHRSVRVRNEGTGRLDFAALVPNLFLPEKTSPAPPEPLETPKDAVDSRRGTPVIERRGGPDAFGHMWVDSDAPSGPAFHWIEVRDRGTAIPFRADDETLGPFPIGFDFPFYGKSFASMYVCSNGWLSFTGRTPTHANQPLPVGGSVPANLVAAFWDDLTFAAGTGRAHYFTEADGSRCVVQFTGVSRYATSGAPAGSYTFEIVLYSNGDIDFQYLTLGPTKDSATIGIQNASRTDALQMAFNTPYVHDRLAVGIRPLPRWITVRTPSSGLAPGQEANVDIELDATGLRNGIYGANLQFVTNDPDEGLYSVPVRLEVVGAGSRLQVGSDEIVARLPQSRSEAHPLRIGNAAPAGGGRLDFRITATLAKVGAPAPGPHPGDNVVTAAWFTVEKLSGSVEAGAFEDIPIRFTAAGLQPGTYDAALTVTSNAASEANATVRLRLEVANPTDTQETLPAEFALAAVENPVRGTARFRIAAPHSGPVDVRIYDVRGREVRRLLSGDLGAGQHVIAWGASDTRGPAAASGVYFVRMQADGFQKTLRITILQ